MVTKKATYCEQKAVLVTLYVEKPRKRLNNHHRHRHLLHHTIKGKGFHENYIGDGRGYNRRALLLLYSQRLRESAQSAAAAASASLNSKDVSSKDQQPINKVAAGQSERKQKKVPSCLGDWKLSIASLVRSFTTVQAKKMIKKKRKDNGSSRANFEAVAKNFKVQKKLGFISKLFKSSQKHM